MHACEWMQRFDIYTGMHICIIYVYICVCVCVCVCVWYISIVTNMYVHVSPRKCERTISTQHTHTTHAHNTSTHKTLTQVLRGPIHLLGQMSSVDVDCSSILGEIAQTRCCAKQRSAHLFFARPTSGRWAKTTFTKDLFLSTSCSKNNKTIYRATIIYEIWTRCLSSPSTRVTSPLIHYGGVHAYSPLLMSESGFCCPGCVLQSRRPIGINYYEKINTVNR